MKSVLTYLFITLSMLSFTYAEQSKDVFEVEKVESLLNERTEIINEFLYGEKDLDLVKEKLSKIEAEDLLEADMKLLEHIYHNPTGYEKVTHVRVEDISEIKSSEDTFSAKFKLKWTIFTDEKYNVETDFISSYYIFCKYFDNKIYLVKMDQII